MSSLAADLLTATTKRICGSLGFAPRRRTRVTASTNGSLPGGVVGDALPDSVRSIIVRLGERDRPCGLEAPAETRPLPHSWTGSLRTSRDLRQTEEYQPDHMFMWFQGLKGDGSQHRGAPSAWGRRETLAINLRAILFGADPADPHHIPRAQLIPIEGLSVHQDCGRAAAIVRPATASVSKMPWVFLEQAAERRPTG
jgi:hypothetical protein